jgi:hypothetical protein
MTICGSACRPENMWWDLMKHWLREGDPQDHSLLDDNFRYFNEPSTDTQGILFRKGRHIVLAFRGSQQIQDWRTNFSVSRRLFKTTLEPTPDLWPQGSVHRGFQGGLGKCRAAGGFLPAAVVG